MTASKTYFGGVLIVMQTAAEASLVQQRLWLETLLYHMKITCTSLESMTFLTSLLHADLNNHPRISQGYREETSLSHISLSGRLAYRCQEIII